MHTHIHTHIRFGCNTPIYVFMCLPICTIALSALSPLLRLYSPNDATGHSEGRGAGGVGAALERGRVPKGDGIDEGGMVGAGMSSLV